VTTTTKRIALADGWTLEPHNSKDGEPARMYTPDGERWRLVERAEEAMLVSWANRTTGLLGTLMDLIDYQLEEQP
jgi:hypothetical protein